jgi:PAS domain S-box-containing protein
MELFYLNLALVTAGMALVSGLINLIAGLNKEGEKTELVFGILCLCGFLFLILPPGGFVLEDNPPYAADLKFKRIFIWAYYALLPFFIEYYSNYKKRFVSYSIVFLLAISYISMFFTKNDHAAWFYISRVALGLILYYGMAASIYGIREKKIREARWLMAAMIIYGILYLISTVNLVEMQAIERVLGVTVFFPSHLNMIAFIVIMGIRLRVNTQEKLRLEKQVRWRDTRWNLLVKNMELMIVELDSDARIMFLNPYALRKLGYKQETELLKKNWFEQFAANEDGAILNAFYQKSMIEQTPMPGVNTKLKTRDGDNLVVNWTNVFVYNKDDSIRGIMKIGMDNTEQVKSFEQIQMLKNELEKENLLLKSEKLGAQTEHDLIGQSDAILYAVQKSKQVATTNAGVLLLGETGSGKELFANLVHRNSFRNNHVFVKVNCAAIPNELIESELFGHEKGAFTSAIATRKGKFEIADGGTIFLDEIGELPLALQPKLLRVLQAGEFERIGGHQVIKVDVRVIAATNRNLQQEVRAGNFREDLFYRLNVFPITIPPLRNRKDDIPLFISHFVNKYAKEFNKEVYEVSKADLTRLCEYSWPGNIRELINLVERSVIVSRGTQLEIDWQMETSGNSNGNNAKVLMEDVEKAHILKILQECNWKINGDDGAASKLGIHPSTLRSKLKKLQIERAD